jgi:hypothetical protein
MGSFKWEAKSKPILNSKVVARIGQMPFVSQDTNGEVD